MRRLLRATPLVVEGRRSWWGEQYVGIDLHRRRSVIVRMTGAGEVLETIRERKAEMDAHADAFVALPGGFGTLEELLEVITLRQLRLHRRPVVLVNVAGYYDPFLAMVRSMVEQGFAPAGEGALFQVAATPAGAVDLAELGPGPVAPTGEPSVEALAEDWTDASTGS